MVGKRVLPACFFVVYVEIECTLTKKVECDIMCIVEHIYNKAKLKPCGDSCAVIFMRFFRGKNESLSNSVSGWQ